MSTKSHKGLPALAPYSRTLNRGAIGASVDGRSREGKFMRSIERQLTDQVGGAPTPLQKLTISRLARVALRLELFDEKLTTGKKLTEHDSRVYGALHNSFRLLVRELSAKQPPAKKMTAAELMRQKAAQEAAGT